MNKNSLLPAPIAALKPVPTAATVRKATAQALYEEQIEEKRRLNQAEEDARKRLQREYTRFVQREAKRLSFNVCVSHWNKGAATVSVDLNAANSPTLDAARAIYIAACEANKNFQIEKPADIEARLRGVSKSFVTDPVKHLLADPKLKAALLAAGKKALSQPTPEDKSTAIEA